MFIWFWYGLDQTPFKNFLIYGVLSSDENESRRLKQKVSYYVILDGELFKRGLTTNTLVKVSEQPIRKLYQERSGLYTRGRSLATKVVHTGYYCPTLRADALDFIKRCRRCQEFVDIPRIPPDKLHILSSPWPFAMWGMDNMWPLSKAPGVVKYLLVTTNYFTRWIEARPLQEITTNKVEKFAWKHLLCKYGLQYAIVTDNDTQSKA